MVVISSLAVFFIGFFIFMVCLEFFRRYCIENYTYDFRKGRKSVFSHVKPSILSVCNQIRSTLEK